MHATVPPVSRFEQYHTSPALSPSSPFVLSHTARKCILHAKCSVTEHKAQEMRVERKSSSRGQTTFGGSNGVMRIKYVPARVEYELKAR